MNEKLYQAKEEFLKEWPFSRIKEMALDEYTNLNKTSFTYWIEAKTSTLGSIWGGSAYKFGIYKRRDITTPVADRHRKTDGEHAWFEKYGTTRSEAFETIKAKIVFIIEAAQNDQLEKIDDVDLGDAYKWKIAFLYGNFNVVNIFKKDSLFEAAQSIKYKGDNKSYSTLNRYILEHKNSTLDYFDYTSELWKKTSLANPKKYWLYSPGESASRWEEFYYDGIMGLGWDALGDLDNYKTKDEIQVKLQELEDVTNSKKNDTTANYDFYKSINIGDVIIVKKGTSELLGYGIVISDYYYDDERNTNQKCRKVDWKLKGNWKLDFSLPIKTLTDVTKYSTEDPNYNKYYQKLMSIMEGDTVTFKKDIDIVTPINQILYGPPGTGKTYKLKNEYFSKYTLRENAITKESFFEETVRNLTWWQVIALGLLENGSSRVNDILNNRWVALKADLSESKNVRATLWGTLQMHTVQESKTVAYTIRQSPLIFDKKEDKSWMLLALELKEQAPELYDILDSVNNFKANPQKEIKHYVFTTFHQSFSYEDFIEGIKPVMEDGVTNNELAYKIEPGIFKELCSRAQSDPNNRYAIFIDEINRGNISQIFGELITLIETDKRLGSANEMKVKLPYSKKEFGVPSNVDIYGTMNTADRSVEALDTALRRRFSFKELMPNSKIVEEKQFQDYPRTEIMERINSRIELLLDRNHTLGHAYFIKDNFNDSFENEIIPLLQEYFYNDYGKIGLILGQGFVIEKNISKIRDKSIFANFDTRNDVDIMKCYELIPFEEVEFESAIATLLA